jgi:hypothetical protein
MVKLSSGVIGAIAVCALVVGGLFWSSTSSTGSTGSLLSFGDNDRSSVVSNASTVAWGGGKKSRRRIKHNTKNTKTKTKK